MNQMECPKGYVCEMYPAWDGIDYLWFFGIIGLFLLVVLIIFWLIMRD